MNKFHLTASCTAALLLAACQSFPPGAPKATAMLAPTKGSSVRGSVIFVQLGDKVRVMASVTGLKPNGEFGFHIQEIGDCSSGDGMSTGGHFDPYGRPHANAGTPERRAGDRMRLESDRDGSASLTVDLDAITISPGPASIVGRGLIVDAQAEDFKTRPAGNAGARSACGVIQLN
jgi:Cu-Zn family superoxide dismutase